MVDPASGESSLVSEERGPVGGQVDLGIFF